jgi:hypothetical protein
VLLLAVRLVIDVPPERITNATRRLPARVVVGSVAVKLEAPDVEIA